MRLLHGVFNILEITGTIFTCESTTVSKNEMPCYAYL